jgi:hypothetical protein
VVKFVHKEKPQITSVWAAYIDAAYLVSSPYICMESVMDQFLRRENVERFRLLAEEIIADETERERTLKLLAEERQKQTDAGNSAQPCAMDQSKPIAHGH